MGLRRVATVVGVMSLLVTSVAGPAVADPAVMLGPPINTSVGLSPFDVAVGDVDGDGMLDAVAVNFYSDTMTYLRGRGDGNFSPGVDFPTGGEPVRVLLADVNGDSRLDAVVTNNRAGTVSVLIGGGDGTFAVKADYEAGAAPRGVAVGDVNGDHRPDLLVASVTESVVGVFLGAGDGTFAPRTTYAAGGQPLDVALADLNGDGRPDVLTPDSTDHTLSVLMGNGDGTFAPRLTYSAFDRPASVAVADFNGDGVPDAAVGVTRGSDTSRVQVLLGTGDGSFTVSDAHMVNGFQSPARMSAHDVNGDWIADLVVGGCGGDDVSVLVGKGDGTFEGFAAFAAGSGPIGVVTGDMNADGLLDVLTANSTANSVSVLLNTTTVPLSGSVFRALNAPERLANGVQFAAGETKTFDLHDLGGRFPTDPTAVSVNVTVVDPSGPGHASIFPGNVPDQPAYPTSVLNWERGERLANGISVKIAPEGTLKVHIAGSTAKVFLDVTGFYVPAAGATGPEFGRLRTVVTPVRVFDQVMAASATATVDLTQSGRLVDLTTVVGVVYNATVTKPTTAGHLRMQPAREGDPLTPTSILNWAGPGDVVANSAITPVEDGSVRIYNGGGTAQVLIDVQGYFVNYGQGAYFYPIDPQRMLDTRTGVGGAAGALATGETRAVAVGPGIGANGQLINPLVVPETFEAVAFNLTEDRGTSRGHLRSFAAGEVPWASINNWPAGGHTRANASIGGVSWEQGQNVFRVYNSTGDTDVIVDVLGYFRRS